MFRIRSFFQNQKGTVLVIVAVGMIALLGLVAIVTDVGLLYVNRTQLVNGVDAAALAGVSQLPASPETAAALAVLYAEGNGLETAGLEVFIGEDNRSLTVEARRQVALFFARVLGFPEAPVGARAVARVSPITGVKGVAPLGVEWEDFVFGQQYQLKYGAQDGVSGNYGALALGGSGASNYEANLKKGYSSLLRVGDVVSTEPGNMSGSTIKGINHLLQECQHNPACTYDSYVTSCSRVVIIPIIEGLLEGRSELEVVGFAAFFLEGVAGSGNENYVTGRFLEMVVEGESDPDQDSYGLQAGRLVD